MKFKSLALASSLAMIITPAADAWGPIGHRVTGELAEQYLTPKAKKAIALILGNETLAEASTWADEMRSHPSEFWKKTASPWHYVTVPQGKTYSEVGAPQQGDAVTALSKFSATLKDKKSTREEKQLALRFIVHIIGDLHQPLHAGNGTDRGGNNVKVKFFWNETNLHRVWDKEMIDGEKLSYTEWSSWLGAKTTSSEIKKWSVTDPHVWIAESVKLRDIIYPKSPDINYSYKYENLPIVKKRIRMAGVRIAAYLNELLG